MFYYVSLFKRQNIDQYFNKLYIICLKLYLKNIWIPIDF